VRITAVGDCGVDRYLNLGCDRPGGISLNFAVCARRFHPASASVGVVSALGSDPEAETVRRALTAFGLDACLTTLPGATSLQCIDREPSGEKVFVRYEAGVLADYRMGSREREVIAGSDVLMAVVYAQVEGMFASVMDCPSRGLRAVDFGDLAGVSGGVELVERYADRFHVGFFGLTASEGGLIDWLERFSRRRDRVSVVTLGAQGSLALGGEERRACPAVRVPQIVDTTGAGDTFAAGFLAEYCRTRRVADSLRHGAERAAESIQQVGAFPWPAQFRTRGGSAISEEPDTLAPRGS